MTSPAADSLLATQFPGLVLLPNERLLSSLRPDIDDALRFSAGLVLLSNAHLHVRQSGGGFRAIPLTSSLELVRHEHAGLTELSFLERGQRVLSIRYTLAVAAAGNDFVVAFEEARGRPSARPATPDAEPDDEFALPESAAPTGHPLLRLLGFARPSLRQDRDRPGADAGDHRGRPDSTVSDDAARRSRARAVARRPRRSVRGCIPRLVGLSGRLGRCSRGRLDAFLGAGRGIGLGQRVDQRGPA